MSDRSDIAFLSLMASTLSVLYGCMIFCVSSYSNVSMGAQLILEIISLADCIKLNALCIIISFWGISMLILQYNIIMLYKHYLIQSMGHEYEIIMH